MKKNIQYISIIYGQNISNKLQHKKKTVLKKPEHSPEIKTRHILRETVVRQSQTNLVITRVTQKNLLVQNIMING